MTPQAGTSYCSKHGQYSTDFESFRQVTHFLRLFHAKGHQVTVENKIGDSAYSQQSAGSLLFMRPFISPQCHKSLSHLIIFHHQLCCYNHRSLSSCTGTPI